MHLVFDSPIWFEGMCYPLARSLQLSQFQSESFLAVGPSTIIPDLAKMYEVDISQSEVRLSIALSIANACQSIHSM